MGLLHTFGDGEPRVLGCFRVVEYSGEITVGEPDKVAEIRWFKESDLPEKIIDSRKKALERFQKDGVFYQELGW